MNASVNLRRLLKAKRAEMTITVRMTGLWRIRFGLLVIKLGARICGMRTRVEENAA